jgi:hypothetical protein
MGYHPAVLSILIAQLLPLFLALLGATVLGETIRAEIDLASTIEYQARAGNYDLPRLVRELEAWRDRVDQFLRRELAGSGADIRFRTGTGQVGGGPVQASSASLVA